ncbi:SGNH/GDSL hydrolase family protein [Vibrio sp. S4M6]|uniref:SGNH/GDSL hydrolase family protein n=1 Tax=Vibrio sinus TaxID=2946865 RepID=UPI002029D066|nr:SGNH/GDSL hydrolase family protein [Vibrio sinus]MCL9782421.1 SGNH/GDSL hydrolase family protein [Vibrio sinus]
MKKRILALCGILSLGTSMASYAQTQSEQHYPSLYQHLIVFGDSLSDQGVQNQNPTNLANNKMSTYTTPGSRMWPEYVATALKTKVTYNNTSFINQKYNSYVKINLGGSNFASGGATTEGQGITRSCNSNEKLTCYNPPSVQKQVSTYLNSLSGQLDTGKNLYAFWSGANNIFITLDKMLAKKATPEDVVKSAVTAATQEAEIINNLKNHFINRTGINPEFLVINLPDLGKTPLGQQSAALTALLNQASSAYNTTLYSLLQTDVIKAYYVDANSLVNTVISNPDHTVEIDGREIKFDNVTAPACDNGSSALTCIPAEDNDHYLFEDDIHPTGLGQYVIGVTAANCVTKGKQSKQPYCEVLNS